MVHRALYDLFPHPTPLYTHLTPPSNLKSQTTLFGSKHRMLGPLSLFLKSAPSPG